ncbi:hypothetical protein [Leeuwenhoekiella sp. MAR_2009_132]|uniref:hypothetical protein n=1 Tax=Leeuwenhoekiella sp. MAR_2009_132 TaxID=1392489 RepID=UPI000565CBC9|nr:hypothetical protein [Leeuwenhoekiella sp. MAR_2009_132]
MRKQLFKIGLPITFLLAMYSSCTDNSMSMVKPPSGVISIEEAKLLDKTYTETRQRVLENALGMEESRSSWWSIEDIEAYIAYAKSQANEKGMTVQGLRIYQGAYPSNYGDRKRAGLGTLFIVPTGTSSAKEGTILINLAPIQGGDDLEIAPLNMGHARTPPASNY